MAEVSADGNTSSEEAEDNAGSPNSPITQNIQNIHYHGPVYQQQGDLVRAKTSVQDSCIQNLTGTLEAQASIQEGDEETHILAIEGIDVSEATIVRSPDKERTISTGSNDLKPTETPALHQTEETEHEEVTVFDRLGRKRGESILKEFETNKLRHKCLKLVKCHRYRRALPNLHQLAQIEVDLCHKINALLLTIECDVMCENYRAVTKNMDQITKNILDWELTNEEVIGIAQSNLEEEKYIHAAVMFYAATGLFVALGDKESTVQGITSCIYHATFAIKSLMQEHRMRDLKKPIRGLIIAAFHEVADKLGPVQNADQKLGVETIMDFNENIIDSALPLLELPALRVTDEVTQSSWQGEGAAKQPSSASVKAQVDTNAMHMVEQAWCFHNIAACYMCCDDFERHAELNRRVHDILVGEFGKDAEKYKLFAFALHNLGEACTKFGKVDQAADIWKKALRVYARVSDWKDENEKTEWNEKTTEALKSVINAVTPKTTNMAPKFFQFSLHK